MTVEAYPGFIQARTYAAEILRRTIGSVLDRGATIGSGVGGVVETTDCKVNYSGTGLNVVVEPGEVWVPGSTSTTQGAYYCRVSAAETLTPGSNASGNPRIDAIIMRVKDKAYVGTEDTGVLEVQPGTAKSGATLANLKGAPGQTEGPAVTASSYVLAYVLIPNGAATITSNEIKNVQGMLSLGIPPFTYASRSINYSAKQGELAVITAAGVTATLPSATPAGQFVGVVGGVGIGSSGTDVVAAGGTAKIYGDFVNGASSITLLELQHVLLMSDGTNWYIVAGEPKREVAYVGRAALTPETLTGTGSSEWTNPSSTRFAHVNLDLEGHAGGGGFAFIAKAFVAGVEAAQFFIAEAGANARWGDSFLVGPGEKLKVELTSGGTSKASGINVSYRLF